MPALSEDFGRDTARAREIIAVFRRHGFTLGAAGTTDVDASSPAVDQDGVSAATTGQRLGAALTELGTTWIKLGQSLSMRPDLVGVEIATSLQGLQAEVPADPPGVARARVESQLGRPVQDMFAAFEDEPFASGSVAQAHRAVLPDGTDVVVKVLHDGAETRVAQDLALMRRLAAFAARADPDVARLRPEAVVAQFAAMMTRAVDLRNELRSMQRLGQALADLHWLIVPRAFPEVSTAAVLTQQFMPGAPVHTSEEIAATGWSVDDMSAKVTNAWLTMIFENGFYHADPHPGNFLISDAQHLVLLDFGDTGFLSGRRRQDVARLLIAVTGHDAPAVTDVILDIAAPPRTIDVVGLESDIDEWLSSYLPEGADSADRDLNAAIDAGNAILHKYELTFPSDLAMLVRVMARLEGFNKQIGSSLSVDEQVGPYIRQFARQQFDPDVIRARIVRDLLGWRQITRDLPRNVSQLLEQIRDGEARVDLNVRDPDGLSADLSEALVTSAALLAAAHLLAHGAPPRVKGISGLGAGAGALAATGWLRLTRRRPGHRGAEQQLTALVKSTRR